jgi:large subunit ribosomal protein L15
MNIFSELPAVVHPKKKRLGRGAGTGKGAKSGRGTTRHQAAREDIPLHFEGGQNRMVKRFPLVRGKARNKSVRTKATIISLSMLEAFETGTVVNVKALLEKGYIESEKQSVKVLGNGKLEKALTIALPVTKSARLVIEKAGGKVQ